ncbi:MAG: helix-turn-helix transcriptional regulator [Pyrinomonadaceae bacterium]|nr:helix-turn-helix transcriptional regulator [Pyrinomonadaceae bacterium]
MSLLKIQQAADAIGVSYPTVKQWIYKGKINSIKTAGGHHRITQEEVDRILRASEKPKITVNTGLNAISGRNKLGGIITEIRFQGLLAQVTIDVGGQFVVSIITSDSAKSLELKKGMQVYALVKATEVMIIRG